MGYYDRGEHMKVEPKRISKNASRLLKALVDHNKERKDIERLAAALDYDDPAQLETDIEDFLTKAIAMRKNSAKRR